MKFLIDESVENPNDRRIPAFAKASRLSTKMYGFDSSNPHISYAFPVKPCFTGVIPAPSSVIPMEMRIHPYIVITIKA